MVNKKKMYYNYNIYFVYTLIVMITRVEKQKNIVHFGFLFLQIFTVACA